MVKSKGQLQTNFVLVESRFSPIVTGSTHEVCAVVGRQWDVNRSALVSVLKLVHGRPREHS